MLTKIENLDLSKYKRFFAFGCSFTGYIWPTWADVLAKEMPDAEYYNFGKSGAGNLFITSRLIEANTKLNFTENDLVVLMYSTFCREDRYITNNWLTPGNIFTQDVYDHGFIGKFADPKGYLLRDINLITTNLEYIRNQSCDIIPLMSVPFNHQNENDKSVDDIIKAFKSTTESMPTSLLELEMKMNFLPHGHRYYWHSDKEIFEDYHPGPMRYRNYLEKLGFPLSNRSLTSIVEAEVKLKQTRTRNEIVQIFPDLTEGTKNFTNWW